MYVGPEAAVQSNEQGRGICNVHVLFSVKFGKPLVG